MKKVFDSALAAIFFSVLVLLITAEPILAPCTNRELRVNGTSFFFYNGTKIAAGNITAIAMETQQKSTGNMTSGIWSMVFNACTDDAEFFVFRFRDTGSANLGFNQVKIVAANPSTASLVCTNQNVSLSGYAVDLGNGRPLNGGVVTATILDSIYKNTTSFSGSSWSVDFYPCLISGKLYTLNILIADTTGNKTGQYFTTYPAG